MPKKRKHVTKQKTSNIVNLDDPDLVLPYIDIPDTETLEAKKVTKCIVKKQVGATKELLQVACNTEIEEVSIDVKDEKNKSIIENLFNYENNNVVVIIDKEGKAWCKGKDVAIILGYTKTNAAISTNITNSNNKKSLADIGYHHTGSPLKIDPQTIFINRAGILQLMAKSRKPNVEKFFEWLADEVIPALQSKGTYTMPITKNDIQRLNKSFYNENLLSDYDNKPVVYLAYVGKHKIIIDGIIKEEHILKFGITREISRRDLDEHRKFYETFNVLGIWETLSNVEVEEQLKNNFESKEMLVNLKIKGMNKNKEENRREHIVINQINNLDYCLNMIDNVVKQTINPLEQKYHDKIKELTHENEMLKQKATFFESMIRELKRTVKFLRK